MNASTIAALVALLTVSERSLTDAIYEEDGIRNPVAMTEQERLDKVVDVMVALRAKRNELQAELAKFEQDMAPKARPFQSTSDLALEACERDRGDRDARDWFYGVRMM